MRNGLPVRPGAIALASNGDLGLVTSSFPVPTCIEGLRQLAWNGIMLRNTRDVAPGAHWSSRDPQVVGYVEDYDVAWLDMPVEVPQTTEIPNDF